ncbi:hypothetical protein D6_0168 [Aeromonas phage D6]|uniref:Uncharacterized protein n=1 Tax=Aeromonas phage D6 TaxID=2593322 RepID=A0A7G7XLK3_9CAUD|nr:hypothetical protein PQC08_gp107 [Aeromonas phage D6]QNH80848.1 hypothetical protein D6_0168 [Aeromonas phage D6]
MNLYVKTCVSVSTVSNGTVRYAVFYNGRLYTVVSGGRIQITFAQFRYLFFRRVFELGDTLFTHLSQRNFNCWPRRAEDRPITVNREID